MTNIDITIMPKGLLFAAYIGSDILTVSRTPFLSAARALLERGYPPSGVLTMRWEGETIISLRATLGDAARLTVVENDETGPTFGPYRPPRAEMPSAGVRGRAKTASTEVPARVAQAYIEAAL
jgi:hypothetical protein